MAQKMRLFKVKDLNTGLFISRIQHSCVYFSQQGRVWHSLRHATRNAERAIEGKVFRDKGWEMIDQIRNHNPEWKLVVVEYIVDPMPITYFPNRVIEDNVPVYTWDLIPNDSTAS